MKTRNSRAFCILFAAWVFFGIINSGVAQEQTLQNAEILKKLIVVVDTENSFGAGIIFDKEDHYLYIITARHVIMNDKGIYYENITVTLAHWPRLRLRAELAKKIESATESTTGNANLDLMATDPNLDLAILNVDLRQLNIQLNIQNPSNLIPFDQVNYIYSNKLQRGDAVYPIGHPEGRTWYIPTFHPITEIGNGKISFDYFCPDGSSGGGLFNIYGKLIGMIQKNNGGACEATSFERIDEKLKEWKWKVDIRPYPPIAISPTTIVVSAATIVAAGTGTYLLINPSDNDDGSTSIVLDSPSNGSTTSLTVTFRWHIDNPQEGETYSSTIFTDKGQDPFDGSYEDKFEAGNQTQFTRTLDKARYHEMIITWGVEVKDSQGNSYRSSLRSFRVE